MTINTDMFEELALAHKDLLAIRTAIQGSPAVKHAKEIFLPNPATITYPYQSPRDIQQRKRYTKYLLNAEFEEYTKQTESTLIGKLALNQAVIEVPQQLEYLLQDSDGDNLSFANGLLGSAARNVAEAKYHLVIADYQGLPELDLDEISIEDAELLKANARVKFKEYGRESLVKYNVSIVDGVRQLDFLMLCERGFTFNKTNGTREALESFIILAIDEGGYYQQKIVDGEESEKVYFHSMPVIPVWVFSDDELKAGQFHNELGYLNKIAELCFQRYRLSADLKEQLSVPATTFISVDSNFTIDSLEAVNGSKVIAVGEKNFIPSDSMSIATDATPDKTVNINQQLAVTKETLKSYGAHIPDSAGEETATKTRSDAAQQNAMLLPLVDNLVEGTKALFYYAGLFEGVSVEPESVTVGINKEFNVITPSADEVTKYVNASLIKIDGGVSTLDIEVDYLIEKGCYPADINRDDIMLALGKGLEG